jgi:hypothetical protein
MKLENIPINNIFVNKEMKMKMKMKMLIIITAVLFAVTACNKKGNDQSAQIAELAKQLNEMQAELDKAKSGNAAPEEIAKLEADVAEITKEEQDSFAETIEANRKELERRRMETASPATTTQTATPAATAPASSQSVATTPAANPASDFKMEGTVLKEYVGKSNSVVIPNSVTSIGDNAFFNCMNLKSVIIPNSVTSIGKQAFYACGQAVGNTSITIPNSVTSIGESAFIYSGLTRITIPDSVKSIGSNAFRESWNLTSITIPSSLTSIEEGAFQKTGISSITIPNSVKSIGKEAFFDCRSLTSVTIGSGVTSIGEKAFSECNKLSSVTFRSTIVEANLANSFPGDLRAKYLAGGPGTYTGAIEYNSGTSQGVRNWTKQ